MSSGFSATPNACLKGRFGPPALYRTARGLRDHHTAGARSFKRAQCFPLDGGLRNYSFRFDDRRHSQLIANQLLPLNPPYQCRLAHANGAGQYGERAPPTGVASRERAFSVEGVPRTRPRNSLPAGVQALPHRHLVPPSQRHTRGLDDLVAELDDDVVSRTHVTLVYQPVADHGRVQGAAESSCGTSKPSDAANIPGTSRGDPGETACPSQAPQSHSFCASPCPRAAGFARARLTRAVRPHIDGEYVLPLAVLRRLGLAAAMSPDRLAAKSNPTRAQGSTPLNAFQIHHFAYS